MKTSSVFYLATIALFASVAASADCLPSYNYAIQADQLSAGDEAGASLISSSTVGPLAAVPSSTSANDDLATAHDYLRVVNLIDDANSGSGLMLSQFAQDSDMSTSDAADFVRESNADNAFCRDGNLLSYDEIVAVARSK